jgi:thiamine transport system substrate-binding protein
LNGTDRKGRVSPGAIKVLVVLAMILTIVTSTAVYVLRESSNREDGLVIIAYPSFASYGLGPAAISRFRERTGTEVTLRTPGDVGTLIDVLNREKGDPRADLVIGIDNSMLHTALRLGLLEPYRSPLMERVNSSLVFDPTFHLTPYDYGYIAIICREELMEKRGLPYPGSVMDLADPVYKGQLLLIDPATSSTGASFLIWSAAVAGDSFKDHLHGLSRNALNVFSSWDAMYTAYLNGEAPIAISYGLDTAYEMGYYGESGTVTIVPEREGYRQIEGAGIVKGARNKKSAMEFLDMMLEDGFQELVGLNVMLPVVPGVEVNSTYIEHGRFAIEHIEPEQSTVATMYPTWLSEWDRAFT